MTGQKEAFHLAVERLRRHGIMGLDVKSSDPELEKKETFTLLRHKTPVNFHRADQDRLRLDDRLDTSKIASQISGQRSFRDVAKLLSSSGYEWGDAEAHHHIGRILATNVVLSWTNAAFRDAHGYGISHGHWSDTAQGSRDGLSVEQVTELHYMIFPYTTLTINCGLFGFAPEDVRKRSGISSQMARDGMATMTAIADLLSDIKERYYTVPDFNDFDDLFDSGSDGEILRKEASDTVHGATLRLQDLKVTAFDLNSDSRLKDARDFITELGGVTDDLDDIALYAAVILRSQGLTYIGSLRDFASAIGLNSNEKRFLQRIITAMENAA